MKIVITIGDPNGIGIEVMLNAITLIDKEQAPSHEAEITIAGSIETIRQYADQIKLRIETDKNGIKIGERYCKVVDCGKPVKPELGTVSEDAGRLAAASIEAAVDKTIAGEYDAVVTMPVSKDALYQSGWKFMGHTEMLAKKCGTDLPLMMLLAGDIRVSLATIHIPVKDISKSLSKRLLTDLISMFHRSLILDFGHTKPSIAVLGLNPHAGEAGAIGTEEEEIINPAIDTCNILGMNVHGPHPADGFFAHGDYEYYDGIFAMYHDQGLIPIKLLARGNGVNFTGGLPIVRTSPDHGTAFDIAGKDKADCSSAKEAIETAYEIAEMRKSKS